MGGCRIFDKGPFHNLRRRLNPGANPTSVPRVPASWVRVKNSFGDIRSTKRHPHVRLSQDEAGRCRTSEADMEFVFFLIMNRLRCCAMKIGPSWLLKQNERMRNLEHCGFILVGVLECRGPSGRRVKLGAGARKAVEEVKSFVKFRCRGGGI